MNVKYGFILDFEKQIAQFFNQIDKLPLTFNNYELFEMALIPMINIIKSLKENISTKESNTLEECETLIQKLNNYKALIDVIKKKGIEKFI